jgi:outer membrane lipoprotein SlyB
MKQILLSLAAVATLAGCVTPATVPSESRPPVNAINTAQRAESCTVVAARPVQFSAPYTNQRSSYSRLPNVGPQQQLGAAIGGIAGAYLGNDLGGSNGAVAGALLGTIAGSQLGYMGDMNASYSRGQEIVVRSETRGTFVVTQGTNPTDRPLYPGQACMLVGSMGRDARVIGL